MVYYRITYVANTVLTRLASSVRQLPISEELAPKSFDNYDDVLSTALRV